MTTAIYTDAARRPGQEVSLLRLYLLRAVYAAIGVLMGAQIWPVAVSHRFWEDPMHGVGVAMLAALTLLSLLGVRYPLKMLPLMIFELAWKAVWTLSVALPAWQAGQLGAPGMMENLYAIGAGVIVCPLIIPWGYAWKHYVTAPSERWR
jgi:hypothetical protein